MRTVHRHVDLQELRRSRHRSGAAQRRYRLRRSDARSSKSSTARTSASVATCGRRAKPFMAALSRGATDAGADVTQVGLISTDAIYFAVGHYGFDGGIMITASHNPAQYNGFKFCREEAIAISIETGLAEIRDKAIAGDFKPPAARGHDQTARYSRGVRRALPLVHRRHRRDQAVQDRDRRRQRHGRRNGAARVQAPAVRGDPAVLRTRRHVPESSGEPDRTREHGRRAARGQGARLRLRRRVRRRCRPDVPVDEHGELIGGDIVTALVGIDTIRLNPGREDPLQPDLQPQRRRKRSNKAGGVPVRSKVGHSFIKKTMRDERHRLRRRALGTFLLQAQLVRRLRDDRADAVPERLQPRSGPGLERHRADRHALALGRDQLDRHRHRRPRCANSRRTSTTRRSTSSTASRSSTRTGG